MRCGTCRPFEGWQRKARDHYRLLAIQGAEQRVAASWKQEQDKHAAELEALRCEACHIMCSQLRAPCGPTTAPDAPHYCTQCCKRTAGWSGCRQMLADSQVLLQKQAEARDALEMEMKRSFMRGVTALNIEAMHVMKTGHLPGGVNPFPVTLPLQQPAAGRAVAAASCEGHPAGGAAAVSGSGGGGAGLPPAQAAVGSRVLVERGPAASPGQRRPAGGRQP
jgi:hypothetical protein